MSSATLVLVMTDVQGSTRLWHDEPEAMSAAMRRHHELVHTAITERGGRLPPDQGEGDAVFAAFTSPGAAIAAVVSIQRVLAAESWPTSVPLRVRVGVHIGEVEERGGNLFGDPVNRCARIRGLGHGGQSLLSAGVFELIRDRLPEGVTALDLGEHRMKDLTRPERVFQLDIVGQPSEFPPLLSLDRARHNLPVQLSSFVGRETDVATVRALLGEHRLVTITGFGGMGKTRLVLQVAAELADGDGDGAWLVDLSAETDPDRLPSAIATVLGIAESGNGPAPAVLQGLADKRLLLVLDNLEQILDSATFVAELLAGCPDVAVLATSREPLRIRGEREYALQPLAIGGSDPESLGSYAAVRLFIDRAIEAKHDFVVTNANAPAVAAICTRLDGHPLSIELAAARIRVLSPDSLLARLDTALAVLTGGGGDRPERQQTLRATIAWSYDALTPVEQRLLDCLSIFPGTATLDAIESICAPVVGVEILDILDALTSLVDKSLVRVHEPHDQDPDTRYSLLVSIRAYAAEQLATRGEAEVVAARHAEHYTELSNAGLDPTPERLARTNEMTRRELHNCWVALAHHQRQREIDGEARMHEGEFVDRLHDSGRYADVRAAVDHLVDRGGPATAGRAMARQRLATLHWYDLRRDLAREEQQRALDDARSVGLPGLYAYIAAWSFELAGSAAEALQSVRVAEEAMAAVPERGNYPISHRDLQRGLNQGITLSLLYVDRDRARQACEALVAMEPTEPHPRVTLALHHVTYGELEDVGTFDDLFDQALVALAAGEPGTAAIAMRAAARLALCLGDLAAATNAATALLEGAEAFGNVRFVFHARLLLAECHVAGGDDSAARAELQQAADDAREGAAAWRGAVGWRRARLARLSGAADRAGLDEARKALDGEEALVLPEMLGCMIEQAVTSAAEDPRRAAAMVGRVEATRGTLVLPMGVADEIGPLLDDLRRRLDADVLDEILGAAESLLPA